MSTFTFTREQTATLIMLYERYPHLYNVADPAYKNRNKREFLLNEIKKEFKETLNIDLTTADIKKKINGLRTQYFKELNLIKKSENSGAGTSELYQPRLWCFELLHFLRGGHKSRESESNLTQTQGEDEPQLSMVSRGNIKTHTTYIHFACISFSCCNYIQDEQIEDDLIWEDMTESGAFHEAEAEIVSPTSSRQSTSSKGTVKRKRDKEDGDLAKDVLRQASNVLEGLHKPEKQMDHIETFSM